MWDGFPADVRAALEEHGDYKRPSEYDEPYTITMKLLHDGARHLLLKKGLELNMPAAHSAGQRRQGCASSPCVEGF